VSVREYRELVEGEAWPSYAGLAAGRDVLRVAADIHRVGVTAMAEVRTVTFVVPDSPPMRTHPGRSADRHSPHAAALAAAGEAAMSEHPDRFPLRFVGMTVKFGKTVWRVPPRVPPGRSDRRSPWRRRGRRLPSDYWSSPTTRDPDSDFYVVTFTSEQPSEGP
jgi:hypothetical protein